MTNKMIDDKEFSEWLNINYPEVEVILRMQTALTTILSVKPTSVGTW